MNELIGIFQYSPHCACSAQPPVSLMYQTVNNYFL